MVLALPVRLGILFEGGIELLMFDADGVSDRPWLWFALHGEGGPVSKLVLVVGHEIDLIVSLMGVDRQQFLTVVVLAMDKGDEQASRLGTQQVFENPRFKIHLELVPGGVLAVFQRSGIAAGCRRLPGFLNLVIGRIRKAQRHLAEAFAEFIFLSNTSLCIAWSTGLLEGAEMAELKPNQALDLWRNVLVETVRAAGPDLSSRQLAIVLTVYLTPPPHTVRGLASLLRISKPAVTRALDRLGMLGLARRRRDEQDRRSVLVQRTVKGSVFLSDFAETVAAASRHLEQQQRGIMAQIERSISL